MRKQKHKGVAIGPCPEHPGGHRPRPITFTYDDEAPEPQTVFEAAPPDDVIDGDGPTSSSVGYTAKYAAGWEAVFGKKQGGQA